MMHYWIAPRDQIFVEGYVFMLKIWAKISVKT